MFLSVMKKQIAHECVLSMIMGEPDLKLKKVHVEQVVLNKSGKRAIRLDAWAVDSKDHRYATEMQNSATSDNLRKRSRFYQGLLDTPILKSGRNTRYKSLPATVITFITQEDIFGKDLARYTFTEQCEEVAGLHLEDGTTKIFLNMSSKNGDPVLISLLQYMKNTTLENPEILVKDERLITLDTIVTEVRQSEEWEDVTMDILSYGIEQGIKQGIEKGIKQGIEKGIEQGIEKGIEQGIEKGLLAGKIEAILEILEELGPIPESLKLRIQEQTDPETLARWLKAALKSDSIKAFTEKL